MSIADSQISAPSSSTELHGLVEQTRHIDAHRRFDPDGATVHNPAVTMQKIHLLGRAGGVDASANSRNYFVYSIGGMGDFSYGFGTSRSDG
jgi:hypothetical protein